MVQKTPQGGIYVCSGGIKLEFYGDESAEGQLGNVVRI